MSDETTAIDPKQTTIAQLPDTPTMALMTANVGKQEMILSRVLASSMSADEVAEILDSSGGMLCSHPLTTVEGVQISTRLLGAESQRMDMLGNNEYLQIDSWLICSQNKAQESGEITDFVSITFGCGDRVIRSSSKWVRRSLGMILTLMQGLPWQPIRVRVQKRPLQLGAMITLAFDGYADAQSDVKAGGKPNAKKT